MRIAINSILRNSLFFILLMVFAAMSAQAQDNKGDDVIRVDTDLIQTDVTVVDKNGKFVEGLKPEQFVLKIDGKPVRIDFFEPVVASHAVSSFTEGKTVNGQQQPATNPGVSLRERKVVFFVDDFHLSLSSLGVTRSAILHFIDIDMMPEDQVIIIAASGNLGFLQQFTNNKSVLRAAVAKLRVMPNTYRDTDQPPMPEYVAVRILNDDKQASGLYVDKMLESYNTKKTTTLQYEAALDMVKQRANNIVSGMAAATKNTLSSLENLLLSVNALKGRKLVFFLSDGFYLENKHVIYATTEGLERAVNLATRSGASIYTIDARGLFSLAAGDATGERPFDLQGRLDKGRIGEEMASQDGMATLSNLTGGRFLKNQNYFDKWIDQVVDENSSYYLLAWTPDKDELLTKKFKSIEVEIIGRPDLKVRQQRGYLTNWEKPGAKSGDASARSTGATGGKKNIPVLLSLSYLDVPNVGSVLGSSVQVSTGELSYGEKNDKPAAVEMMAVIFDEQGKKAGTFKTGLTINPNSSTEQSVIYSEKTPLAPGVYQVQVQVRETQTGVMGAAAQWIEIPDLSKNQLTLGSLFLGGQLVGGAGKSDNAAAQVQFSVDRRFNRPVTLDFMYFVYNAAHATEGVRLATRVEVLNSNGQTVIDTDLRPLVTKGNLDLARIPVRGSIKQQTLSPGNYLLRMTVADNIANTKATQQTVFIVD
ncbi:MAG TPA: VWA domain-containing protein [Pyrinomonadaceae bacterium]|jgi:VWFA-related protein|nr:VWA domain-containing protein [Pyrinomonadaceae bacterium]